MGEIHAFQLEETIMIASYEHIKILKKQYQEQYGIHPYRFYSFQEISKKIIGNICDEVLVQFAKEGQHSYEIGAMILKYALLIEYEINDKTKELYKIKQQYLQINYELFLSTFHDKKVVVFDVEGVDSHLLLALKKIKEVAKEVQYISTKVKQLIKPEIISFRTEKEEIEYVVTQVASLLYQGVPSSNIKIHLVPSSYHPYLLELFYLHKIDVDINENISFIENEIVRTFLDELTLLGKEIKDPYIACLKAIEGLNKKYKTEDDQQIIQEMTQIMNDVIYIFDDVFQMINFLTYKFKMTKQKKKIYQSAIQFIDVFHEEIKEQDYIFVPSFNQDILPSTFQDNEYLSDKERKELNLITSKEKNIKKKEFMLCCISSFPRAILTYSLKNQDGPKVKSSLLSVIEEQFQVKEKNYLFPTDYTHSILLDHLKLAKHLDAYYKFGVEKEELFQLEQNYHEIEYRKYSNKFTGVDYSFLDRTLQKSFRLSYTSIDQYYKCPFVFYLERILKIKRETNTDSLYIGNLFHAVLHRLLETEVENEEVISEFIKQSIASFMEEENRVFTEKELYFIRKYEERLFELYQELKRHQSQSKFRVLGLEKEFSLEIDRNYKVVLNGKIDKILLHQFNQTTYAMVVDYKTGSTDFDLNRVFYGINMQIMFYFYFLNQGNTEDVVYHFGGGYLQGVLPSSPFAKVDKKTYRMQEIEYYKLEGYSNDIHELLHDIDQNVGTEHSFLNGIRFTTNGTYTVGAQKHLLSEVQFRGLLTLTKNKIMEAIDLISRGSFPISPIRIGSSTKQTKEIDGCSYCSYADICFKTEQDYHDVEAMKDFSFLGGEEE